MTSVQLLLPEGGLLRWHEKLARVLAADGVDVFVALRPGAKPPVALTLLDALERLLFARHCGASLEAAAPGDWMRASPASVDLVFDLTGHVEPAAGAIFPIYNGGVGEAARDASLLDGRAPLLGLAKVLGGRRIVLAQALPALERATVLRSGRDAVATRLTTLIRACVRSGGAGGGYAVAPIAPALGRGCIAFSSASLVARARSKLSRILAHEGHWRVGWRRLASEYDTTLARLAWSTAEWSWLDDDRRRYFADPFLFEHDGVVHVFCEEYPYMTAKGVISHFSLDEAGCAAAAPRIVLERPYHLSYPLVFKHESEIWMMPESSGARALDLYRADPFPFRWTLDRTLISDMAISDATFFESDGRFWLTAATNEDDGSSWDCLSLFSGQSPLGPWIRCGNGPVVIDASAARPAGGIVNRDGVLWRPAQDCTAGYGSGLALCRIDHVGDDGLRQSVECRLGPPTGAPPEGVHTLNAAAGFETIDAVGLRGKGRIQLFGGNA